MQPELSESSPKATPQDPTSQNPSSPNNHGNRPNDRDGLRARSSHEAAVLGGYGEGVEPADSPANSPERDASGGDTKGVSPTRTPPRNRIADYENALSRTPKGLPKGPSLQVVRKERGSSDEASAKLTDLPNGMFPAISYDRHRRIACTDPSFRGTDSRIIAPLSLGLVVCSAGVASISRRDNNSTRLASGFRPLLSGGRIHIKVGSSSSR